MTKKFTAQNFKEEVLDSKMPVLVDFWAPWCAPCQMMGPIIEKLSEELKTQIKIGKLNVDEHENNQIASEQNIQGIPAFKIFKDGQVVAEFTGMRGEDDFKKEIEKYI